VSSDATQDLLAYIDASPTPFHAVAETARRLEAAGFESLDETKRWTLAAGDKRFLIRNGSTLIAFVVGADAAAHGGFRLVGAHTDSPNLRLKPVPEKLAQGVRQVAVEPYGGLLIASWADRDLSIAGRFVLRDGSTRLLKIDRPLCRVAQLAIHLNRGVNDEGLKLNKQTQLPPLIGLCDGDSPDGWLVARLCAEAGVEVEDVAGFDLMLFDVVPSCVSGLDGEFVHAPRLDNLGSCHAGVVALIDRSESGSGPTRGIALYDHEEVGSRTAEGAESALLQSVLERIVEATGGSRQDYHRAIARSLFISADMAHAIHPNFPEVHEPGHLPRLNAGPVIKSNSNARYASNAGTSGAFRGLARKAGVEVQEFVNRSDLACGSTIGPATAARLGMAVVDVGNPMLSMHSIREMCGSADQDAMIAVLAEHFA
jgi:aspartyl aminopeptidase